MALTFMPWILASLVTVSLDPLPSLSVSTRIFSFLDQAKGRQEHSSKVSILHRIREWLRLSGDMASTRVRIRHILASRKENHSMDEFGVNPRYS